MPDWLRATVDDASVVTWNTLLVRLIAAFVLGLLIAGIYRGTRQAAGQAGTFPTTLVLLCILIALVTQVIGGDVARAFSLVGTLSIVRFRTVVRDTKDTAFVIFAVVIGMAAGAGQVVGALCGTAVVGFAAFILRDRPGSQTAIDRETILTLRFTWSQALEKLATDTASKFASEIEPTSVVTVRQGTAIELAFRLRLLPSAKLTEMVAELNRIEGIQSVELHTERNSST